MARYTKLFAGTVGWLLGSCCLCRAADIDAAPICYGTATPSNSVSHLQDRLAAGQTALPSEAKLGYLRSVLAELKVPESSQVLVFSKTSLQRQRISPHRPRALYFNDDVYVGFCQNGDVLEISAADPCLGTAFYTIDQKSERATITRQGEACLLCHASSQNEGLPGHLLRSVYADAEGLPILAAGTYRTDQTSPWKQRWGGWYVSGTTGKQAHLGNWVVEGKDSPEGTENNAGANRTDLSPFFKTSAYLTPHSDVVALMVLAHQTQMHNRITRANFLTRIALHDEAELNKALGQPSMGHSPSTLSRIKSAGEPLVKYLLFSEEAPLSDRVTGTSGFAQEFSRRGPFDRKGRSLRDLDLQTRLMKNPCSFLIYSEAFDALPCEVKEYVYGRLWDILTGKDTSKEFAHLTPADRMNIREILLETKPSLPNSWRQVGGVQALEK
jgi:hypothetical protein